jgi:hypothetical protein
MIPVQHALLTRISFRDTVEKREEHVYVAFVTQFSIEPRENRELPVVYVRNISIPTSLLMAGDIPIMIIMDTFAYGERI